LKKAGKMLKKVKNKRGFGGFTMIFVGNLSERGKKTRKKVEKFAKINTDVTDLHGKCAQTYVKKPNNRKNAQ